MSTREPASNPSGGGRPTDEFVEQWRNAAYNCFSSGHKFCREVCPVMQVTRDERHTPTAFHANVVAMEQGPPRRSRTSPTTTSTARSAAPASCAARTRCSPATSTASARGRSTSSRRCARWPSSSGIHQPDWKRWNELTDRWRNEPVLGGRASRQEHVARLGRRASTSRSAARRSSSSTARRRSTARRCRARSRSCCSRRRRVRADARAVVLRRAGGEMGYVDRPASFAEHNVADWRAVGAKRDHRASTRTTTSRSPRTTRSTSATT